jgi:hypothetical protein
MRSDEPREVEGMEVNPNAKRFDAGFFPKF